MAMKPVEIRRRLANAASRTDAFDEAYLVRVSHIN